LRWRSLCRRGKISVATSSFGTMKRPNFSHSAISEWNVLPTRRG